MYQFIKGKIVEKITEQEGNEKIILEAGGIGYEIYTTLASLSLYGKDDSEVTVYTTLIHKEDSMALYGFPTLLEREMFNLLLTVSGIGPKSALSILSNLTVSEVSFAILNEEVSVLSRANGIGERIAGRIILELKGKIKNWQYLPIVHVERNKGDISIQESGDFLSEARSILKSLGYSNPDISQAITHAKNNSCEKLDSEKLIHFSLKWLSSVRK